MIIIYTLVCPTKNIKKKKLHPFFVKFSMFKKHSGSKWPMMKVMVKQMIFILNCIVLPHAHKYSDLTYLEYYLGYVAKIAMKTEIQFYKNY